MLLKLLGMELKMDRIIGWLITLGIQAGVTKVCSKLPLEIVVLTVNVMLDKLEGDYLPLYENIYLLFLIFFFGKK